MKIILLISAFFILNLAVSCGDSTKSEEKNPCKDVVCGEYGTCKAQNESFICECSSGYKNDSTVKSVCVENNVSPLCKDIACGELGNCIVENYKAKCKCDEGSHNETNIATSACIKDTLCHNISCGDLGTCVVENDAANCKCETGSHNKSDEATSICISDDPCKDISCGDQGTCIADTEAGTAICKCNDGFHNESELATSICVEDRLEKEAFSLACTKMLECGFGGEENLDLCITKYYSYYYSVAGGINAYYVPVGERVADYANCINAEGKSECSEFELCYDTYAGLNKTEEACDTTSTECSDDHTVKACVDGKYQYANCSVYGKKCLAKTETSAFCTNDVLCDSNTFQRYCNDAGSLVYCYNGVTQEYYCPFYGKECKDQGSEAACIDDGTTPSCENNLETKCENGNMIQCRANKQITTSCVENYGENFTCMSFSYLIADGNLRKNPYGCFYEDPQ